MKIITLLVAVFLATTMVGCGNIQDSSTEEARYVVEHAEDFKELLVHFEVDSIGIALNVKDPHLRDVLKNDPNPHGIWFVHVIAYKTINGYIKLVFLSDGRPPTIVSSTLLGEREEDIDFPLR